MLCLEGEVFPVSILEVGWGRGLGSQHSVQFSSCSCVQSSTSALSQLGLSPLRMASLCQSWKGELPSCTQRRRESWDLTASQTFNPFCLSPSLQFIFLRSAKSFTTLPSAFQFPKIHCYCLLSCSSYSGGFEPLKKKIPSWLFQWLLVKEQKQMHLFKPPSLTGSSPLFFKFENPQTPKNMSFDISLRHITLTVKYYHFRLQAYKHI